MGSADRRFDALVGVGGIGTGTIFAIDGEATLGREESRAGRILDRRDYCKLHIVAHYVRALLGPTFAVVPIGRVGDDPAGRRLLAEMASAGLDVRHVEPSTGVPTLFSFSFVYPDGSGGNLTTSDSAAARLDPAAVARADGELRRHGARGIALALPEVPLAAREALLEAATAHGSFRVASFTTGEIHDALDRGLVERTDLLAINRDEAAALGPSLSDAIGRLRRRNPGILVSATAGGDGSWSWDGKQLRHRPAHIVSVESTAGAGDAHLAGILAGLAGGLDLPEAQELGGLVAAMSVTSPHAIDDRVVPSALGRFADDRAIPVPGAVRRFLEGLAGGAVTEVSG